MKKVLDGLEWALGALMTLLFAVLIVPVTMQILSRYFDAIPRFIWTEEIARFCFIWIIMLGAMIAVRHDSHFDVDLLAKPRTKFGAGFSKAVVHVTILILALCFIYYGIEFTQQGLMQSSEIADLPMVTIYIAWPLSGVVWALFAIEKLIKDIALMRGKDAPSQEAN